ncbi:sensor histidine kinase [Streptomyces oryzae]|uniref:Oxygen sensor histidine kinase NreB n=1 Tax=Streptomyces oryzae TaxID=1434886 RepID=A0ABS3X8A7_9ACTN|nr:sensor histidine kinase [Streptomyces oryzae]MBO8191603.1 sensor histidine kinase [Streptomyces oryzae]
MARTVEGLWTQFFRYGPYALLGLATLLGAVAVPQLMTRQELYIAGILLPPALALQTWWSRALPRLAASRAEHPVAAAAALPEGTTAGGVYFALRTVIAFALTWLNPFFALYACLGYFDAGVLLRPRAARVGLLVTAVPLAGSQSGGLPPAAPAQWIAFAVLLGFNATLALGLNHLGVKEAQRAEERARTIAALEQALAENSALHDQLVIQAREAGVADERRRLAAEIHDTIAQGLTGIIAQLQVVAATPDPGQAREHLDRAQSLARRSLGEARRSVHNLAPAALEHDTLPEALKKTVAEWSERTGVPARFTATGTAEPLHEEVAATLLRIAQEALANTAKHAAADRVGVTLSYMGDEITLDVRDDGRGFDQPAAAPRSGSGGFGLDGMRARAARIAGSVAVESEPGQGTAISARVPLVHHD